MPFTREINRLMFGMLALFALVAGAAAYWAVAGPDTILQRPDNPRRVQAEAEIRRGDIFDRDGIQLVTTALETTGSITRTYHYPAFASALGYSSLRYGVSGAEAAFNPLLRGDTTSLEFLPRFVDRLLHRAQVGSDVRLTFDLDLQQAVMSQMESHQGAVILLDVPSGQVLSMVSLPTYDPNTLDENWETLVKEPGNPFFNRALQGTYQPGAALQTPLMAAALLANYPVNTPFENARQELQVGNVNIQCAKDPARISLTLEEAYQFGCPYPFAELVKDLGIQTIQSAFNTFALENPPSLEGYIVSPPQASTQTPSSIVQTNDFVESALGQGSITVSPIEMAVIAAAILNDGNAPFPYTLLQVRTPQTERWESVQAGHTTLPMLTANSARQLQVMMEAGVSSGAANSAARIGLMIGGHVALAYVGESSQAWFIGFINMGSGRGAAIAVVLEDTSDVDLAAQIGGSILASANQYLNANPVTPQPTAGA